MARILAEALTDVDGTLLGTTSADASARRHRLAGKEKAVSACLWLYSVDVCVCVSHLVHHCLHIEALPDTCWKNWAAF